MADFIRFTKLPIDIDDTEIFATSATMSESIPLQRVNSLGYNGAIAVAANGPIEGTWNVDFTYTQGMNLLLNTFRKNWDSKITIVFGGNSYTKAVMTTLNFSAEANSIVQCSAGGNFYSCLGPNDGIAAAAEKGPLTPDNYKELGHGSKTAVSSAAGLSSEYFNFNWEASRSLISIYKLNSAFPIHLDFSDETVTATAQGNNLQSCISSACDGVDVDYTSICPKQADLTFNVGGLCGEFENEALTCDGFVQDRNVEVSEGDVLRGNITLVDWYSARTIAT
tara:strand:+ start:7697 stop:8536 length:840 start_codon:yes stop_codon:yes gene_type:complete